MPNVIEITKCKEIYQKSTLSTVNNQESNSNKKNRAIRKHGADPPLADFNVGENAKKKG